MELAVATGDRVRRVRVVRPFDALRAAPSEVEGRQDGSSAIATAKAERLQVTVDGRVHEVDVRQVDASTLSLLLTGPNGAARSVQASLVPLGGGGAFDVHVGGRRVPVQVQNGRRPGAPGGGAGAGRGPLRVAAPMPGKIVRVLVKPGDDVRARQGLVVVEAMKMENELRAARDGRVRHVAVAEGQSVDAGTVLVEIEAAQ